MNFVRFIKIPGQQMIFANINIQTKKWQSFLLTRKIRKIFVRTNEFSGAKSQKNGNNMFN